MRSRLAFKNVRPEDWGLRQKASQVYARGELAGNWQATGAPIHCHPAEVIMPAAKINRTMSDGEEIAVGGGAIRAMHTPGHTPGSTCSWPAASYSPATCSSTAALSAPNRPPTSNKALLPSRSASTRCPMKPSSSPATAPTP